jgi:two-component system, LuxR family, sensor kinase FixL
VGAARLARELLVKDAQLRESQERLSLAAEAVDAGLWSIDTASGRLWATDKGRALFHLDPVRDLTLDDVLAHIHPEDRPLVEHEIARALAMGDQARVEYRAMAPDGSQRWLMSWGRVCAGPHGQARILTGVTLDFSARKALEDENRRQRIELAHLARAATLSELSGALAHELNQPLTSILSNAEAGLCLLARAAPERAAPERAAPGPELVAELGAILRDIAAEDQRAAEVIRRLRALLQRGEPQPQRLACNEVVQGVLSLLRGDLADRGLSVELHLHPALPAVQADRVLLEQVMLNLIANACDALAATPPAERRLTIATDAADGGVLLSVCDNGQGLPTGAGDIFAPFVTTKFHGLGMGLAIARSVASAHHGRLWAEPGPTGGACLHLHLPAAPESS